jgi:hypothetical protein
LEDGRVDVRVEADVVIKRLELPPAVEKVAHALADERVGAVADDPEVLERRKEREGRRSAAGLVLSRSAPVDLVDLENDATRHLADRECIPVVAVRRLEWKARRDEQCAV